MNSLEEFKNKFWLSFSRPQLVSDKFKDLWSDLETISDTLAGPLYSIYENGECKYVFYSDNEVFAEINNLIDFLNWCLHWVNLYRKEILNFIPDGLDENNDQKALLEKAQRLEELSYLAYKVISKS